MRVLHGVYGCIAVILYATFVSAVEVIYDAHTLSNGTVICVPDRMSMRYLMRTNVPRNMGLVHEAIRNMTVVDRDRVLNGLPALYTVGMPVGNATTVGSTVSSSTVAPTTIISLLPTMSTGVVQQNGGGSQRANPSWIHDLK
ncbi:hypothetical protein V1517DRAFT_309387 [Lipomyces orientalis]|uniref:Uncharacterized protein n=1 Tax=Lipomyces orientalis TaxID=1233043 RepID=A0ACC3TLB9_9ASCO